MKPPKKIVESAKNTGIAGALVLGVFGMLESRNNRLAQEAAAANAGKQDAALMLQLEKDIERLDEIASKGTEAFAGMSKQIEFLEKAVLAALQRPRYSGSGTESSHSRTRRYAGGPDLSEIVGEQAPQKAELPKMKTRGDVAKSPKDLVKQMQSDGYLE